MEISEEERKLLEKYHPECLRGEHVPCATVDKHNRVFEVFCQHCLTPMTKEQYLAFFTARGRLDALNVNFDEPADPKDVDFYR